MRLIVNVWTTNCVVGSLESVAAQVRGCCLRTNAAVIELATFDANDLRVRTNNAPRQEAVKPLPHKHESKSFEFGDCSAQ